MFPRVGSSARTQAAFSTGLGQVRSAVPRVPSSVQHPPTQPRKPTSHFYKGQDQPRRSLDAEQGLQVGEGSFHRTAVLGEGEASNESAPSTQDVRRSERRLAELETGQGESAPAHLQSHSGPGSSAVFLGCPTGPEFQVEPEVFRTLVFERLRQPLPATGDWFSSRNRQEHHIPHRTGAILQRMCQGGGQIPHGGHDSGDTVGQWSTITKSRT